jgi:hypothetical protein
MVLYPIEHIKAASRRIGDLKYNIRYNMAERSEARRYRRDYRGARLRYRLSIMTEGLAARLYVPQFLKSAGLLVVALIPMAAAAMLLTTSRVESPSNPGSAARRNSGVVPTAPSTGLLPQTAVLPPPANLAPESPLVPPASASGPQVRRPSRSPRIAARPKPFTPAAHPAPIQQPAIVMPAPMPGPALTSTAPAAFDSNRLQSQPDPPTAPLDSGSTGLPNNPSNPPVSNTPQPANTSPTEGPALPPSSTVPGDATPPAGGLLPGGTPLPGTLLPGAGGNPSGGGLPGIMPAGLAPRIPIAGLLTPGP